MGYSKSIRAFNRVKDYLDLMVVSNDKLVWNSSDPAKDAYNIREGVNVAQERAYDEKYPNREAFKPYAALRGKYIVRAIGTTVVAEPRDLAPNLTPAQALGRMVISEPVDPMAIVSAVIVNKAPEMFFPSADLSEDALRTIYAWSSKNNYFLIANIIGVTLTKTDPGEIAWRPASL